jgi:hypothetical protein
MSKVDDLIDEALSAEERALLRSIGDEPHYFQQLIGVFGGRTGWVNLILMFAQAVTFVAGVWMAWQFFQATDLLSALRWGLPSSVLLLTSLMLKLAVWPSVQTNRVMRELKRVELQIARGRQSETAI